MCFDIVTVLCCGRWVKWLCGGCSALRGVAEWVVYSGQGWHWGGAVLCSGGDVNVSSRHCRWCQETPGRVRQCVLCMRNGYRTSRGVRVPRRYCTQRTTRESSRRLPSCLTGER